MFCFVFLFYLCHYSAVIEHTNRVIFLEDDDVAAVVDGRLSIHRIKRTAGDYPARAIQTLQMELQQIMKGKSNLILSSGHFLLWVSSCEFWWLPGYEDSCKAFEGQATKVMSIFTSNILNI